MAEAGIRQFLDIGTGIPTANNTHEVAQAVAADARVVYVDDDPIVLSHARALLTSTSAPTAHIDAEARDTAKILAEAAELLDLSQPTAVMLIAVLHCIPDSDGPYQLVADLMDAVPAGSFLAVSHPARDQVDIATKAEESLTESMGQKVTFRTREQVSRFFTGLELADPGVVAIQDWRADSALDLNSPADRHVGRRGPQELTRRWLRPAQDASVGRRAPGPSGKTTSRPPRRRRSR
jgi:hypothetical protein